MDGKYADAKASDHGWENKEFPILVPPVVQADQVAQEVGDQVVEDEQDGRINTNSNIPGV